MFNIQVVSLTPVPCIRLYDLSVFLTVRVRNFQIDVYLLMKRNI